MKCRKDKLKRTLAAQSQNGSALVIAILVLLLMMGFVALAISKTTTDTLIAGNDASEARAYAASEADLESSTRDFADVFERKLIPDTADLKAVEQKSVAGFDDFTFSKSLVKTKDSAPVVLTGGTYSGLYALRDSWEVTSTAAEINSDVKVKLKRRFFIDRIPIFQFGMFFEKDLELNRPSLFTFGGRVHTNGNLFVTASSGYGIYFKSKVTAAQEIINDVWKPGMPLTSGVDDQGQVFVNDASGNPQELKTGEASVNCTNYTGATDAVSSGILPGCNPNPDWDSEKQKFQGNLQNEAPKLTLPLSKLKIDLIELIKRGKNVGDMENLNGTVAPVTAASQDSYTLSKERFSNKTGIRISLSDSQAKLPGCANVAAGSNCGVRLDGSLGSSVGYQPLTMADGYKATALNGTRLAMNGREVWIKVELVNNNTDSDTPLTADVTQDILSLGVTEPAPIGGDLQINGYDAQTDSRSVIKLQRFSIPGPSISSGSATSYLSNYIINGNSQNLVVRYKDVANDPSAGCSFCTPVNSFGAPAPTSSAWASSSQEDAVHLKWANINNAGFNTAIVPFPIEMFNSREGLPNDDQAAANSAFGSSSVPSAGVISMIDIDAANLRRFLNGNFDNLFPQNTPYYQANNKTLRSVDVPNANGWVLYVSDRRGDYDFDGQYDMEDIFPDGTLQFNEDVNQDGILNTDYGREAASYSTSVPKQLAAVADHLYYRRGVRIINASTLPGIYDQTTPENTKGFTVASENGVYVKGNYNATGAGIVGDGSSVTPPENYSPQNTANHIPAAIASDAVTVLSNSWNDAESFASPFDASSRVASDTVIRFAMLSGNSITGNQ